MLMKQLRDYAALLKEVGIKMSWEEVLKGDNKPGEEKTMKNIHSTLEEYPINIGYLDSLMKDVERLDMFVDDHNYDSGRDMISDVEKLANYTEEIVVELKAFFENPVSEENPDGHQYRKEFRD